MILVSPFITGFLEANLDLSVVDVKMALFFRGAEENKAPEAKSPAPSALCSWLKAVPYMSLQVVLV